MKYLVRIDKRVRYLKVCSIKKKVHETQHENLITRFMEKIVNRFVQQNDANNQPIK